VRIAVIGTGKMGRAFATALSRRHEVIFGSRNPDRARNVVASTGAAGAATPAEAAAGSEVVILAVPWRAIEESLEQLQGLEGTVVVDVTAPYSKEREALGRRSSGEHVQKRLRRARVVKGWNHVFARDVVGGAVQGIPPSVLIAGDDEDAKRVVAEMARDMEFHAVDVGSIRQSHHLDRLIGMLVFVKLGPFRVLRDL
jgi:predicted dinucleotide-binding enzyme